MVADLVAEERSDVSLTENLLTSGILDSTALLGLFSEVEREFDLRIDLMEADLESLLSISGLASYVTKQAGSR